MSWPVCWQCQVRNPLPKKSRTLCAEVRKLGKKKQLRRGILPREQIARRSLWDLRQPLRVYWICWVGEIMCQNCSLLLKQTSEHCTVFSGTTWSISESFIYTSSTAQGGGGSFKNRKPIGEVGCCESGMVERSHWWTDRCLISLSLPTYLPI